NTLTLLFFSSSVESGACCAYPDSHRHAESRSTQPRFDCRPALRVLSRTGAGGRTYRHAAKHLPSDLDGRKSGLFNGLRVRSPSEREWSSSADPPDLDCWSGFFSGRATGYSTSGRTQGQDFSGFWSW